jgi:hypothetical protein
MWEEPRPERLRELDSDRSGSIEKSVLAWAVIFGVAAILLKVGAIDLGRKDERVQPPAPEPVIQAPPTVARPTPARSRSATDPGTTPDARAERPPQRRQPATNTARGDPSVMRTLIDTCQYWVTENTNGQYWGNQQMACQEMVTYAREHGFPVPAITGRAPSLPSESHNTSPQHRVSIDVNECNAHTYGSVAYRQCRAREKRRLANECQALRNRLEYETGASRESVRARASATCSEAERYRIVQ